MSYWAMKRHGRNLNVFTKWKKLIWKGYILEFPSSPVVVHQSSDLESQSTPNRINALPKKLHRGFRMLWFNCQCPGSIPGWGTKISQVKKKKRNKKIRVCIIWYQLYDILESVACWPILHCILKVVKRVDLNSPHHKKKNCN